MAKNQATLTFAGDPTNLQKAFGKVSSSAKEMAANLDAVNARARSLSSGIESTGSAIGNQESKFMGAADVLDGLNDALGLNLDRQIQLFRAAGDVTGGVENLKGSFASLGGVVDKARGKFSKTNTVMSTTAKTSTATAVGGLGKQAVAWTKAAARATAAAIRIAAAWVLSLGPIGLIIAGIGAVVAALVLAWKKSETFRDIVKGAFSVVAGAVMPIVNAIQTVIGWFGSLINKIKEAKDWLTSFFNHSNQTAEQAIKNLRKVTNQQGGLRLIGVNPTKHAAGGVFTSPHVGMVAEAGPEAIIPLSRPARARQVMASAGLGGGSNVNIYVNALDPQSAAKAVYQAVLSYERQNGRVFARV